MAAVGVSTITPPELTSVRGEDIVKFDLAYERYLQQIQTVNLNRTSSQRITPCGIRACVSAELLLSLTVLRTFSGCQSISEVKDDHVQDWIKSRSRCSAEDMATHVSNAISRVKFKPDRLDPQGAACQFFTDVTTQLRLNRVDHAITDAPKAIIVQLLPKVEPVVVRDTVASAIEYWPKDKKWDFHHFMSKVVEAAIESANYIPKRSRDPLSGPTGHLDRSAKKTKHSFGQSSPGNKTHNKNGSTPSKSGNEKKNDRKNAPWTDPCLNPKCDKIHAVKDCQDTSEEDKKMLLRQHYDKKKKKLSRLVGSPSRDGRWSCVIENKVDAIALGDIGADYSAIPKSLINSLRQAGIVITVFKRLNEPLHLDAAIQLPGDVQFTASAIVKLCITISLPCGPLRLRNVEFLVIDQTMDEILLGRPLLRCLGFDLDTHLERIRPKMDNADISTLMSESINTEDTGRVCKSASILPQYKGLWHNSTEEDPIQPPDSITEDITATDTSEVDRALDDAIRRANANGMSANGVSTLRSLLTEFKDVFRTKMGPDPPASIDPFRIRLKPGCTPRRATQRRYATPQRAFISSTIKELEKVKAVYANPKATWASPALAVHKSGPDKFRFTVDLRGPNSQTIPIASAMPDLGSMIAGTAGSKAFAKMDMLHAYWQLSLHPDSQECMSIQTPLGVFTPTRVLQGSTDAGNHFQSATAQVFMELQESLAQWQDDFLVHATDEVQLLKVISRFLQLCAKFGLKLHAKKVDFFLKEAKFCGRIIDKDGVRYDPRGMDTLMTMRYPEFASDLQQFLCATNWMRSAIPDYSRVISPLHNLMEQCYGRSGKRTKRSVRNIALSGQWGPPHTSAFNQIREHLANALKLAHPKPDHLLCLFSDASETHWASIITQVPKAEGNLELEDQHHEPMSFLSGSFTGSASNWSIVEKEAFAVVESMSRMEHLTASQEVSLFTDHANLVYIFDPHGQNPGISRHIANKLMRWALKLSGFRYVIEHVPGDKNVWADMLTRWAVKPRAKVSAGKLARLMLAPINPSMNEEYDWPTRECLAKTQRVSSLKAPRWFTKREGIYQDRRNVIWIPKDDETLKLRILVAAHAGLAGHRGTAVCKSSLKTHFYWKTLAKDIETFCRSCLHCMLASSNETVPRPLGHSLHADGPNRLIHFDYCYVGRGEKDQIYVLIIKDDFSSYVWLMPCSAANAETTVDSLIKWFSAFGTVSQWVSDRGSHFKNEVVRGLREKTHGSHHFTLPYCPWTNGTVEVVCRELIRAMRAILSEFQMPSKMWPRALPTIQALLNSTPLRRLGNRAPITAFTALPPDSPLNVIKNVTGHDTSTMEIDGVRARQVAKIDKVLTAVEQMHREVIESVSNARRRRIEAHNRRTHVRACYFDVGDYVLWGTTQKGRLPKLTLRWKGPYQVTQALSDFLFIIRDLRSDSTKTVHGTRLRFFRNSAFEVDEVCKNQLAFQENEYCIVEEIQDIRLNKGEPELLVKWTGFDDEDPGWENFEKMREDVPGMVNDFLTDIRQIGTAAQKRIIASV